MAVIVSKVEMFVNAAWTTEKKVPKKSPFGVPLVSGVNAFATVADAIDYAEKEGLEPLIIDGDKKATLDNSVYQLDAIYSQEIKGTVTENVAKGTGTGQSKIVPSGALTLTGSDVADMKVEGFKDVTISGSTGSFVVEGGNNLVKHTFNVTTNKTGRTEKESATVTGKADGTLTVNGAEVVRAGGVWAEVDGTLKDDISIATEAFADARPGDPASIEWATGESVLTDLPGYATVTLTGGASAGVLKGGTLNFTHAYDAVYTGTEFTSLNKTYSVDRKVSGKLTVEGAAVDNADFYATVSLAGASDFGTLRGGNLSTSEKTTYKLTSSTKNTTVKTTVEETVNNNAAGSLVVDGLGDGSLARVASSFAKVTVKDARVGDLFYATNVKSTSKTTTETVTTPIVGGSSVKETSNVTSSYSCNAGGTLTTDKASTSATFNNISGYGKIELANATVTGGINVAGTYNFGKSINQNGSMVMTVVDGLTTQRKYSGKSTEAAAGTVTLSKSVVSGAIVGGATVKLTNTDCFGGPISAGKAAGESSTVIDSAFDTNTRIYTSSVMSKYKNSGTANGTLTMLNGTLGGNNIGGFAAVTLTNAGGSISYANAENWTQDIVQNETWNYLESGSTYSRTYQDSKVSSSTAAGGTFTATAASGGLEIGGGLLGYSKVTLTGVTVGNDIINQAHKTVSNSFRACNSKTGALTSSGTSSLSRQLGGTVAVTGASVTGNVRGYQTVTLDGATVSGDINDYGSYRTTFSAYRNEYSDSGATLTKQTWSSGFSYAPATVLTLKNGAVVSGSAYGVKTLTLSSGAAVASDVSVEMRNGVTKDTSTVTGKGGLYTENYQYTWSQGAPGTVTATGATVGDLQAAGKVTATDATLGEINGVSSFQTEKITRVGSNLVSGYDGRYYVDPASGVVSINSSYTESENAVGNATLTRTTAGYLYGVGTVKLTGGAIDCASAGNSKSIESCVSSATAYNAVASDTWGAAGAFTAKDATVTSGIIGYATITLDGTTVGGSVGGSSYVYRHGSKNVSSSLKQTFAKDGATLLTQNFASASSYSPTVTLTLKNGAVVSGSADGIKTLNLAAGTVAGGNVYMDNYARKESENITSNKKTGLYEEKTQYTSSQGAAGVATIAGISGSMDQVCGDILGAAKVTATDAVIGDLFNSCTVQGYTAIRKGAELGSWYQSRYVSDIVEYDLADSSLRNVSGTATLTRTNAGLIFGFATVNVTDGEIEGAFAGTSKVFSSATLKDGVHTYSCTSNTGVQGAFTATKRAIITGDGPVLAGFATVTLTDCYLTGDDTAIIGGSSTVTMSGTGATEPAASASAAANATSTFAAAGTLTAKNTLMDDCVVSNYATVNLTDCYAGAVVVDAGNAAKTTLTLTGINTLGGTIAYSGENPMFAIDGIANVTVKSGSTEAVGKYGGYSGTAGNDVVTVNAKTELALASSMLFGAGTDTLTVNGTVRVGGAFDAANLEKLSGSGLLALDDANCQALLDGIAAGTTKRSGKLEIVAAGTYREDVWAVRTKKEELADDTVKGARKFDGIEMAGWLCGVDDAAAGKFADTEDWIKFTNVAGESYEVDLTDAGRSGDVLVQVWKDGVIVQKKVDWDGACFAIDNTAFAAGAEYQLRLTTTAGQEAFSYNFCVPAFG